MRRKLNNKKRDVGENVYGTLFGITRYSFMILGDEGDFNYDIIRNHCKNIYSNLVSLLLVERASILRFSNEISKLSQLKINNTKLLVERASILRFSNEISKLLQLKINNTKNKKLCKHISELYRHYIN